MRSSIRGATDVTVSCASAGPATRGGGGMAAGRHYNSQRTIMFRPFEKKWPPRAACAPACFFVRNETDREKTDYSELHTGDEALAAVEARAPPVKEVASRQEARTPPIGRNRLLPIPGLSCDARA